MAKGMKVTMRVQNGPELVACLRRLRTDARQVLVDAVKEGAQLIADRANQLAPEKCVLVEVVKEKANYVEAAIGLDPEKWEYQFFETGASAHEISTKKKGGAKALMFEGDSGLVITGSVEHPGMAAQPFLRPAGDEKGEAAKETIGARLMRAIGR